MRVHAREIRRPRNGSRSGVARGKFPEVCRSVLQYRARVTFRRSSATLAATGSRAAVHKYRCRISPLARTFAAVRKWKSAATFLCACGRACRGAASLKRKTSNFSVAPGRTAIVAPSISTARQMNFRHRPGTSHSALGWMNMAARLWLACGSRACAQPSWCEIKYVSLHCHPEGSAAESKDPVMLRSVMPRDSSSLRIKLRLGRRLRSE